jgi:hypothetical protein
VAATFLCAIGKGGLAWVGLLRLLTGSVRLVWIGYRGMADLLVGNLSSGAWSVHKMNQHVEFSPGMEAWNTSTPAQRRSSAACDRSRQTRSTRNDIGRTKCAGLGSRLRALVKGSVVLRRSLPVHDMTRSMSSVRSGGCSFVRWARSSLCVLRGE